jgi:hypothetical protein
MKIKDKRIAILTGSLLLTLFAALLLMSRIIIEQNGEITSLLRRVHNLEIVINKDLEFRIEKQDKQPERQQAAFNRT